jgi:hypothetical protein
VQRWGHAVESVVADDGVFPAHRIVERVGARVAPVPVEIVLGERGAHASRRDNTDRSLARSALARSAKRLVDILILGSRADRVDKGLGSQRLESRRADHGDAVIDPTALPNRSIFDQPENQQTRVHARLLLVLRDNREVRCRCLEQDFPPDQHLERSLGDQC